MHRAFYDVAALVGKIHRALDYPGTGPVDFTRWFAAMERSPDCIGAAREWGASYFEGLPAPVVSYSRGGRIRLAIDPHAPIDQVRFHSAMAIGGYLLHDHREAPMPNAPERWQAPLARFFARHLLLPVWATYTWLHDHEQEPDSDLALKLATEYVVPEFLAALALIDARAQIEVERLSRMIFPA